MNMNMNIRNQQSGFTLIELVIVIVILGILAAVAVPRFVDLSQEAEQAAVEGVAGALASASAINFAACKAGDAVCDSVAACTDAATLLQGGLPVDYAITDNTFPICTLTGPDGSTTATFQTIAVTP